MAWTVKRGKVYSDDSGWSPSAERIVAEIERLQAIVDKLPTTADGVPVVPGMMLYLPGSAYMGRAMFHADGFVCGNGGPLCEYCYGTREAAEAAGEGE